MHNRDLTSPRTNAVTREAIRESSESLRALAKRYGLNLKTVAKWKNRPAPDDLPSGPRRRPSRALSDEQEEIVVAFRRRTLLPLDDCLYALQAHISGLTRATLYRCLVRHGEGRLPEGDHSRSGHAGVRAFIGCVDIEIRTSQTADGPVDVLVAMDRASKFVVLGIAVSADERALQEFVRRVHDEAPFAVRIAYVPATAPFAQEGAPRHLMKLGAELDIEFRQVSQTPGSLKGFSGFDGRGLAPMWQLGRSGFDASLQAFVYAYNHLRRLKTLRGLTPYEFVRAHGGDTCTTSL